MKMAGRSTDYCVRALAAMLLVMAVAFSVLRPGITASPSTSRSHLLRHAASLKIGLSGQPGAINRSTLPLLRATVDLLADFDDELEADIEDEITIFSSASSVFFEILISPCPKPYTAPISLALALETRPMRC